MINKVKWFFLCILKREQKDIELMIVLEDYDKTVTCRGLSHISVVFVGEKILCTVLYRTEGRTSKLYRNKLHNICITLCVYDTYLTSDIFT